RRAPRAVGSAPPDGGVRHPRSLGGDHAGRSRDRHDAAAGPHQADSRGEPPASARRDRRARDRRLRARVRAALARARRRVRGARVTAADRRQVLLWRLAILAAILVAWEWLTGIKA